jgi:hypothetical protein
VENGRLQSGQRGEKSAESWFLANGWFMVRTQPPITILGMVTRPILSATRRVFPRMALFGHMVIARLGKGGVPDYTGYFFEKGVPVYVAMEVKEANDSTMPASRLDKAQREFMRLLPKGCAFVGILWESEAFEVFPFIEKGSYKQRVSQQS